MWLRPGECDNRRRFAFFFSFFVSNIFFFFFHNTSGHLYCESSECWVWSLLMQLFVSFFYCTILLSPNHLSAAHRHGVRVTLPHLSWILLLHFPSLLCANFNTHSLLHKWVNWWVIFPFVLVTQNSSSFIHSTLLLDFCVAFSFMCRYKHSRTHLHKQINLIIFFLLYW